MPKPFLAFTIITFSKLSSLSKISPVSPSEIAGRIAKITEASLPWLVAEKDDTIIGFAYASMWKERSAYRFAVETTVYLTPGYLSKGIGTSLYQVLLNQLKTWGFMSLSAA